MPIAHNPPYSHLFHPPPTVILPITPPSPNSHQAQPIILPVGTRNPRQTSSRPSPPPS
ncbi:hypothetical protein COCSADRAFT_37836 [Bipolaris sorokiniana ND90Pr]|uniref:Uncharacterized protein n=1 Tax=Cochliobolus sativus (strain ND90Pr / ATCC 201652) TaxID=665912 RepID=M2R7J8_COCSN|nr:uncharacterized protein COCSADRAFT_37836 [Bipolaris sorokiniana ND90Pr]EMD62959.1 hypothetical protein COCSADRAFT_37836 [Bipolaris sorokiniana ND90Pr]